MNYIMNFDQSQESYLWGGQVLLISSDALICTETTNLIKKIGGRINDPIPVHYSDIEIEERLNTVAVIFHFPDWSKETCQSLKRTAKYCLKNGTPLLILLQMELLDEAVALLHDQHAEYLIIDGCKKLPAELIVTLNSQISAQKSGLFDSRDEMDLVDLKKISADVDRIARVLSQLSGEDSGSHDRDPLANPLVEPKTDSSVADAQFQFAGEEAAELIPFGTTGDSRSHSNGSISAKTVRDMIKARRLRDQYFDPELFADPAWDMLLDLMAAKLEGSKVSVSSLCIAASVPPTTALRWIKTMTEENVFVRRADENDGRRVFIELSDEAAAGMIGYLSMIRRNRLAAV